MRFLRLLPVVLALAAYAEPLQAQLIGDEPATTESVEPTDQAPADLTEPAPPEMTEQPPPELDDPAAAEEIPTLSEPAGAEAGASPDSGLTNPNPLSNLVLQDLKATLEAPLFTPSRTAPPPDVPVVEAEPVDAAPVDPGPPPEEPPPALELVGIILTGSTQTALLRNPTTDEVLRLKPGEEFDNWALAIIDGRSVELRRGDRVQGFKMFEKFAAPSMHGQPYGEGMPDPQMEGQPPLEGQPPTEEGQPPLEGEQLPQEFPSEQIEGMPGEFEQQGGVDPQAEGQPAEDFAPDLGEAPIPEEGTLLPGEEAGTSANQ